MNLLSRVNAAQRSGFTLIEGIIAVGIISTALIVGLALAISNLSAAQANSDRIIAGNLAREALEVVRNIRDSNWLRRAANFDKDSAAGGIQFYAWDDFFGQWPVFNQPGSCEAGYGNYFDIILVSYAFSDPGYKYQLCKVPDPVVVKSVIGCINDATQPKCRVQKLNGVYHQQSTVEPGRATSFYRRVILRPICYDQTLNKEVVDNEVNMNCDDTSSGGTNKGTRVGVMASSHVVWLRGNKTYEVLLKERLYNWRPL